MGTIGFARGVGDHQVFARFFCGRHACVCAVRTAEPCHTPGVVVSKFFDSFTSDLVCLSACLPLCLFVPSPTEQRHHNLRERGGSPDVHQDPASFYPSKRTARRTHLRADSRRAGEREPEIVSSTSASVCVTMLSLTVEVARGDAGDRARLAVVEDPREAATSNKRGTGLFVSCRASCIPYLVELQKHEKHVSKQAGDGGFKEDGSTRDPLES